MNPAGYGLALLLFAFPVMNGAHGGEMRVFRSADGKTMKAVFEGMADDKVKLRREDGRSFELPLNKFSAADQTYLKEEAGSAAREAEKLNQAAGHALAGSEPFPQRKAEDLAAALGLRPESRTRFGSSWRLYAAFANNYRLFGAMPYSVALYSNSDGLATSLSIVYANKGDFGSTAGFGEDHFSGGTKSDASTLTKAMETDEAAVTKALESVLGPGKTQRYGEGGARRKVTRWDWNGHAFLLSNQENEYVGLSVVPTAFADAGGKSSLTKDGDVKKRLRDSIVREKNGDVYLTEIPMVDQGPKGYCVPATFERAMRAMGLEADMYLLAMIGQSRAGGGTSVNLLLENVRSQVYRKGRRTRDVQLKQLRIRDVSRYIDQGIPVMWVMRSAEEFNRIADANTAKRAGVEDWKTYAGEIEVAAKEVLDAPKPEDRNHICMIIGYNEATSEFAVSDSWGPRFERRWVPVSVAEWASMGAIFLILP